MRCVVGWVAAHHHRPSGLRIKSSMTDRSGNDGRPTLHLWIADQVRNDMGVVASSYLVVSYSAWRVPALWIPAYAGMTVRYVGNDGEGCWE